MTTQIHPSASTPAAAAAAELPISFLIPVYNGLELTRVCLRTLEETVDLRPHEVILIDDCSTDGTSEFLDQLPPPYRVIHNPQRSGYAIGMNRGAAIARGRMLCLLNSDLVFQRGWLPPMLRAFDKFEKAGIVGNVQISPRTGWCDHMGIVFNDEGVPLHFARNFRFRLFRGYKEWPAVTAACVLVRKSVFLAAGGFCESYRNGYEDVELCLVLSRQGYHHYVANASVIGHYGASSEGRMLLEGQNKRFFLERWREQIQQNRSPRDYRLAAFNYFLTVFASGEFRTAVRSLVRWGH